MRATTTAAVAAATVLLGAAGWQTGATGPVAAVTAAALPSQAPAATSAPGAIDVTWASIAPAPTSWRVLRSSRPDGPWAAIATVPGEATEYADTTAAAASYYEVQPVLERWVGGVLSSRLSGAPEAAVAVIDDFAPRSGDTALGSAGGWAVGGDLAWHTLGSDAEDWTRSPDGAVVGKDASPTTIATVDAGTPDVAVTEHVRAPGDAAYVRVQDADDWLRARVDATTTHVSGGYESYATQYQWKQPDQVVDEYEHDTYRWTVVAFFYQACSGLPNGCILTENWWGDLYHPYVIPIGMMTTGTNGTTAQYVDDPDGDCGTPPPTNQQVTDCAVSSSTTYEVPDGTGPASSGDRLVGTRTLTGTGGTYWWDDPATGAAAGDVNTGVTRQVDEGWVDTSHDEEDYTVVVDRDVAGDVTTLATHPLGTSFPGYLRLIADGTSVSVATGPTPSTGTSLGTLQVAGLADDDRCGVGLAPTTDPDAAGSPRLVGGATIGPAA